MADLLRHGAARVNLLHLQRESVTHGWHPGDEAMDTVTARRPVIEASLSRLATAQRGLTLRRGVRVTGLLIASSPGVPHVQGIRTGAGDLAADLVVDASGRHTPVPGWVHGLTGASCSEDRERAGLVYLQPPPPLVRRPYPGRQRLGTDPLSVAVSADPSR